MLKKELRKLVIVISKMNFMKYKFNITIENMKNKKIIVGQMKISKTC